VHVVDVEPEEVDQLAGRVYLGLEGVLALVEHRRRVQDIAVPPGEEFGREGRSTDTYWTIDPIDGTKGFLRGDQYAVALALVVNGKVELGVLGCPHLSSQGEFDKDGSGAIFVAMRGKGAWSSVMTGELDFQRLQVYWDVYV